MVFEASLHQRPQIGDKSVVPGHQFEQLASSRSVLILETMGLARLDRAQSAAHDFLVQRGKFLSRYGKKRATIANPCAIVRAFDGFNVRGFACPVSRL